MPAHALAGAVSDAPARLPSGCGDDPAIPFHLSGDDPMLQQGGVMSWFYLFLAGVFEVVWAIGLKHTDGFSRLWPTVGTLAAMAVSFGLLAMALKTLPLGTAYAIWTGIGAVGTVAMGIVLFGEPATAARLLCVALIVCGIIGLKMVSS